MKFKERITFSVAIYMSLFLFFSLFYTRNMEIICLNRRPLRRLFFIYDIIRR